MSRERIEQELSRLHAGAQKVELLSSGRMFVLYRELPTAGAALGLPRIQDVIVPVPSGYPAGMIDLAGLPVGSPFLKLVKGGQNNQGTVALDGRDWQLASFHPHNNGGGPPWDQTKHGFHTYIDYLISWLHRLG